MLKEIFIQHKSERVRLLSKSYILREKLDFVKRFLDSDLIQEELSLPEVKGKILIVLIWDCDKEEEFRGRKINFIPLWKWLFAPAYTPNTDNNVVANIAKL